MSKVSVHPEENFSDVDKELDYPEYESENKIPLESVTEPKERDKHLSLTTHFSNKIILLARFTENKNSEELEIEDIDNYEYEDSQDEYENNQNIVIDEVTLIPDNNKLDQIVEPIVVPTQTVFEKAPSETDPNEDNYFDLENQEVER